MDNMLQLSNEDYFPFLFFLLCAGILAIVLKQGKRLRKADVISQVSQVMIADNLEYKDSVYTYLKAVGYKRIHDPFILYCENQGLTPLETAIAVLQHHRQNMK